MRVDPAAFAERVDQLEVLKASVKIHDIGSEVRERTYKEMLELNKSYFDSTGSKINTLFKFPL